MKHFTLLISLFIFFISTITGQEKEQIDSIFADKADEPGCVVAVFKDGKVIFSEAYGYANMDYDIKNTSETVFDIGSISKQFTAACIVILANEGKISLDDPVRKHIPELPKYTDTVITIKHLIYHTSGIRSYPTLQMLAGIPFENLTTPEHIQELIFRQKALNFNPGDEFLYNNSGYFLLSEIVRRISGKEFNEFAQEKLFKPLGMENTFFYENRKQVVKNRAVAYFMPDSVTFEREHYFEASVAGAGGLHTTLDDFQKWDENYYTQTVGGDKFYDTMHEKVVLNNGDTTDYAFGLGFGEYKGLDFVSHGGAWGAFTSSYVRFDDQHMSFVLFSNSGMNAGGRLFQVIDIFMKEYFKEEEDKEEESGPTEISKKTLKMYEGRYKLDPQGLLIEASIEDDSLKMFQTWNKSEYKLTPTSDTTFVLNGVDNLVFSFRKIEEKEAHVMHVFQNGNHSDWLREEELPKKANIEEFTGLFYSEELLCTYTILTKNDSLFLNLKYQEPMHLELAGEDEFSAAGGKAKFYRNDDGKVIGMYVDSGRVRNIHFVLEEE